MFFFSFGKWSHVRIFWWSTARTKDCSTVQARIYIRLACMTELVLYTCVRLSNVSAKLYKISLYKVLLQLVRLHLCRGVGAITVALIVPRLGQQTLLSLLFTGREMGGRQRCISRPLWGQNQGPEMHLLHKYICYKRGEKRRGRKWSCVAWLWDTGEESNSCKVRSATWQRCGEDGGWGVPIS